MGWVGWGGVGWEGESARLVSESVYRVGARKGACLCAYAHVCICVRARARVQVWVWVWVCVCACACECTRGVREGEVTSPTKT